MRFRLRHSRAPRAGLGIIALVTIALVGQGWFVATSTADVHLLGGVQLPGGTTLAMEVRPPGRGSFDAPAAASNGSIDFAGFDGSTTASGPVGPSGPDGADLSGGLQPSIQYEEFERHAADRIAFTPGTRVTVGYQPRPGDRWTVGGTRPGALPAGRLDGKAIRAQDAGGTPPLDPPADPTTDLPSGGPVPADATSAAFRMSAVPGVEGQPIQPDAAVSVTGLRREIFGFLPYWEVNSSSLRLDYSKISTIAYFGVGADATGNLQKRNSDGSTTVGWSGWTSSAMTSIISTAHSNHTRVVLTVQSFGWNTSGLARQKGLLGSSTNRLNLARQIAAAVRDRGADGVNLDFEPLAPTYDAEFTALVRTIRAELNRIHSGYQITFDTTGSIGNYPIADATAAGGADAIFIMGYDYRAAASSPVGSIAPLSRNGYDIRDTIVAYTARVAPSKLILGVPYYGRAWSTNSDAIQATNTSSTRTGASTTVVYDTAADYLAQYGRRYDATEGVAWTAYQRQNCTATYGCVTSWRQLYVDDATAIGAKYDLVNSYGLRGAGIWALGYDGSRPELWATIQRKFVTDTTPPTAGVRTLATRQVNPLFTVSWTGTDDVAVVSYDVQASTDGGAWASWLTATKAASGAWYGVDGHAYAFRVRARDPKGNIGPWNVTATSAVGSSLAVGGFGLVRIDGLSIRAAADTNAAKLGTYANGDLVAIVGGPRAMDGYTWFQVVGALTEWGSVGTMDPPAWVATGGSGATWLSPTKAPNATRISAALGDLAFDGGGAMSLGSAASATAHRTFSPNGDGARDTLAIDWTNDRALDSLVLRVFKAAGTLVGNVPINQLASGARHADWNGTVGGTTLANGRYLVSLVGTAGGTAFSNPSPTFIASALPTFGITIDTVAPVVSSASIGGGVISPNGDGILDTVRVSLAATGADGWTFRAAPLAGTTVGAAVTTRSGNGGSASVAWDGRTNSGAVVPDGSYRLTLTAMDRAANSASRSWLVRVDDTAAAVTASAAPILFSPNGDGATDSTRLAWSSTERISGNARVYHGTTVIRSWSVVHAAAGAINWLGTDSAGRSVADGTYSFRLTGRDAAGNLTVRSTSVAVDRTLSTLRWSRSAFFPQDGDAIAPSARLTFSLKRSAAVTVRIFSGATLIRTVWTNRALAPGAHGWTWNGRNAGGAVVPLGTYQVQVSARSSLGTAVLSRSVLADAFATTLGSTSLRAGQTLTVTFTTTEPLRSNPATSFTQPGRTVVTRTATALGSGRYRVTFSVAAGAAGTATLRISGRDTAGGLNTITRSITIR